MIQYCFLFACCGTSRNTYSGAKLDKKCQTTIYIMYFLVLLDYYHPSLSLFGGVAITLHMVGKLQHQRVGAQH